MGTTAPTHQGPLAALVGRWHADVEVFPTPGAAPIHSQGRMVNTLVLGGRYLEQRYEGQSEAMQGVGYWVCNASGLEYVWMDTLSDRMMIGRGDISPDGRVLRAEGGLTLPDGGSLRHRSVLTLVDNDQHTYDIYMTRSGGEEYRSLHITYTRSG